jgi:hypothetical protein
MCAKRPQSEREVVKPPESKVALIKVSCKVVDAEEMVGGTCSWNTRTWVFV